MQTRYGSPDLAIIMLTLEPGETFGAYSVAKDAGHPNVYPITVGAQPSPDGIELLKRIADGSIPKPADWDLPGGPPPTTPIVLDAISDRQFWQQLAIDDEITEDEALSAVSVGSIPKKLLDIINTAVPAAQRFDVRMKVQGAREFRLSDPTTQMLGQLLGYDTDTLKELWSKASLL